MACSIKKQKEDLFKSLVCTNSSDCSLVAKDCLVDYAIELQKKKLMRKTKDELVDILLKETKIDNLLSHFSVGVTTFDYQKKFNIEHKLVKKAEKKGLLKVVGHYFTKAFKYGEIPLYDIDQFVKMQEFPLKE